MVLYVDEDKQAPRDTDSERRVSGIKFAMVGTLLASKYKDEYGACIGTVTHSQSFRITVSRWGFDCLFQTRRSA